jgi:DNA transposition AAA+ family ATPase
MLPRDKKLTAEQIDEVRQAFVAYLKQNKLNYSRVADPVGYSAPVLSEWVSGKYSGDVESVTRRVNDWMERDARRSKAKRPAGYIPTQVAEDMRSIIITADKAGMMAAIVAPSGSGKTFVLKSLEEELNGLYIRCDDTFTPSQLLRQIARSMGAKALSHFTYEVQEWVVERLRAKRHVLMLDEAQHLKPKTMSRIRTLHDAAGVTVILVGTADILEIVNDRHDGRGQFSRRCIRYNVLEYVRNVGDPRGGAAGGRDLFSMEEVRSFFASKRIRLHRDGLEMLWLIACLPNYGTLGFAEKVASIAIDMFGDEEALTRDTIMQAMQILMGDEVTLVKRYAKQHLEESTGPARMAATA